MKDEIQALVKAYQEKIDRIQQNHSQMIEAALKAASSKMEAAQFLKTTMDISIATSLKIFAALDNGVSFADIIKELKAEGTL